MREAHLPSLLCLSGLAILLVSIPAAAHAQEAGDITRHRLHARLEDGVALVFEELALGPAFTVGGSATLELPEGAALVSLESCGPRACTAGRALDDVSSIFEAARHAPLAPGSAPLAYASQSGRTVYLRVAFTPPGSRLRVGWSMRTETLDGRERAVVPARTEAVEIELAATHLDELAVDEDPSLRRAEAGRAFELSGRVTAGATVLSAGTVRTAGGPAGWARVVVPPAAPSTDPVVLFVDVSPSALAEEEALRRAIGLMLASIPDGTDTRIVAFARHAREVARGSVEALREAPLPFPTDLGPMTSAIAVGEALAAMRTVDPSARALWLGDGGLAWGSAEGEAAARLRVAGVRFVSFHASGRPSRLGAVSLFSPELEPRVARARTAGFLAPPVSVQLGGVSLEAHAGEASWIALARPPTGRARGSALPAAAIGPLVQAELSLGPPPVELIAIDPRELASAEKVARGQIAVFRHGGGLTQHVFRGRRTRVIRCRFGCSVRIAGVASTTSLRRMIRRAILPRVRGCFAAERRGRPEWSARATLVLGLEGPEVAFADVETESAELRSCVLEAVDHVHPPHDPNAPEIRVMLHYPFVSETLPRPAAAPLGTATEARLDALFGGEPTVPDPALLGP